MFSRLDLNFGSPLLISLVHIQPKSSLFESIKLSNSKTLQSTAMSSLSLYYGVGRGHGLEQLVLRQYRCRLRSLLV